jgi:hypothetical protein
MPLAEDIVAAAATNVQTDVEAGFSQIFRPGPHGGFAIELNGKKLEPQELVVSSNSVVGVPWVFTGEHVYDFLGVCPTGIVVALRGGTFVDVSSGGQDTWTYSRFIDYLGALHQLGVTAVSRPAFEPKDFEAVVKYMRGNPD